ncbi:MAG: hypothetical protein JWN04_4737 [Myxococcaceae bacterium]|nr:hypothetical protein [Myxococcaceae bacterium]
MTDESAAGSEAQIETLKELWLTDTDLSFLHQVEPATLARITSEVKAHSERVQAGQKALYEGMARTTRFIPNFLLAKISGGLSPYVMARITEHLEPKTAASLSKSYEPALLAEISLHLDAQLAAKIASYTDLDTLTLITETLSKKGLSRRLGEISDALDEKMLGKLMDRIADPVRLASVAAHMTATDKLASVAKRLDNKMRQAVITILQSQGHTAAARTITG